MARTSTPNVVFQQSLFTVDTMREKWPHLGNVITCRDQLTVAFEHAAANPKLRKDPVLAKMTPKTAKEVLDFYNHVVADGRYVAELATDARSVAKKLKYDISDLAFETIKSLIPLPGDGLINPGLVVVGGGIVVVGLAAATAVANYVVDPRKQIVIDQSGIVKF